ncbi:lipopolysaccharide biosynthesis protein [Steroidobacter sp.]|uniref:lipopolysaccharide biosynthesis protein n=1 Tax=Steroidobacter sp. TaxID=1978227 RepID=UPI001A3699EE|nr:oligosaccharide flippase family protein [Steroidobacter sp.]MBL8267854.1 oligosaccharide flippase family protein [Steroidobacter sp.]
MRGTGNGAAMVALITSGALVSQALAILSMPVLSRVYTAEEIGYYSVFTAAVGLFAPTASLHYELAIPLPKSTRSAVLLMIASLATVAFIACTLWLLAFGYSLVGEQAGWFELPPIWALIPAVIALTGVSNIALFYAIRNQRHRANAAAKTVQGVSQAATQVGGAFAGLPWWGMVSGQVVGLCAGIVPLWDRATQWRQAFSGTGRLRMLALMRRHKKLPLLAAPSSLVNAAATNAPAMLIAAFHGAAAAGLYGLSVRILQLPSRFVGQSVAQVFLGRVSGARREGRLAETVFALSRTLVILSLHTFVPLAVFASSLFAVCFGPSWAESGLYSRALTPWLLAGFISIPLSVLVTVLERQREEFVLQILYLALIAAVLMVSALGSDPLLGITLLGISGGVFLAVKIGWLLGLAGCDRAAFIRMLCKEVALVLLMYGPLIVLLSAVDSALLESAIGLTWMMAAHGFNWKVRRVYVVD